VTVSVSEAHRRHSCSGLVAPLAQSVQSVFATMLHMTPEPGSILPMSGGMTTFNLSVVVQLTGTCHAIVAISFEERAALSIASTLRVQQHSAVNDEVIDAIGEMGNLIVGHTRPRLPGPPTMSLPKVFVGRVSASRGPRLLIPYAAAIGDFTLEIGQ